MQKIRDKITAMRLERRLTLAQLATIAKMSRNVTERCMYGMRKKTTPGEMDQLVAALEQVPVDDNANTCPVCGKKYIVTSLRQKICESARCKAENKERARRKRNKARARLQTLKKPEARRAIIYRPTPAGFEPNCPFKAMKTGVWDYKSWDCPEMDPLTNRLEPVLRFNVDKKS